MVDFARRSGIDTSINREVCDPEEFTLPDHALADIEIPRTFPAPRPMLRELLHEMIARVKELIYRSSRPATVDSWLRRRAYQAARDVKICDNKLNYWFHEELENSFEPEFHQGWGLVCGIVTRYLEGKGEGVANDRAACDRDVQTLRNGLMDLEHGMELLGILRVEAAPSQSKTQNNSESALQNLRVVPKYSVTPGPGEVLGITLAAHIQEEIVQAEELGNDPLEATRDGYLIINQRYKTISIDGYVINIRHESLKYFEFLKSVAEARNEDKKRVTQPQNLGRKDAEDALSDIECQLIEKVFVKHFGCKGGTELAENYKKHCKII